MSKILRVIAIVAASASAASLMASTNSQIAAILEAEVQVDFNTLTANQQAFARFLFTSADTNRNGSLDFDEYVRMLAKNGVDTSSYPLWLLQWGFIKADYDKSGTLNGGEALDALLRYKPDALPPY